MTLKERSLRKQAEAAAIPADRRSAILALGEFYKARGAFRRMFDAYRGLKLEDASALASAARLTNDSASELRILKEIYFSGGQAPINGTSKDVGRLLEILYDGKRELLQELTGKSSRYQFQTINFLLAKGERALVHRAIESASMPEAWKLARHSEASLALGEIGPEADCYFCRALKLESVGEMVSRQPDKDSFLINDEWFRLARNYGVWLERSGAQQAAADLLLPAMTENRPTDASVQYGLGLHYIRRGDIKAAIRHLRPAAELAPGNQRYIALLGAALLRDGDARQAAEIWSTIAPDEDAKAAAAYISALHEAGLSDRAASEAERLLAGAAVRDRVHEDDLGELVRTAASVFESEAKRAAFFERVCGALERPGKLLQLILNDSLVNDDTKPVFLQKLVEASDPGSDSDWWFKTMVRKIRSGPGEAEAAYDQQMEYEAPDEPATDRYVAQRQLFELLVVLRRLEEARETADRISKDLAGRFARPVWLRLGLIELDILERRYDPRLSHLHIGIDTGSAAFTEVKPPDVERLNDVLRLLSRAGMVVESAELKEAFHSRNLAVGQYDLSSFQGLASALFSLGRSTEGSQLLGIMTDAFDPATTADALRRLDLLPSVKTRLPVSRPQTSADGKGEEGRLLALAAAASVAEVFGRFEEATKYRRTIFNINPADSENAVGLADLLFGVGERKEAKQIRERLIADKFALRPVRWTAVAALVRAGRGPEWKPEVYDAYSLQLAASTAASRGQVARAIENGVAALIADPSSQERTRRLLTELYSRSRMHFAALGLGATLEAGCEGELCKLLSKSAEAAGDPEKAISYEEGSGSADAERIARLREAVRKKNVRVTDYKVDQNNLGLE